ncbi:MAG: ATP-binding protein [Bacteroidota bacterium]
MKHNNAPTSLESVAPAHVVNKPAKPKQRKLFGRIADAFSPKKAPQNDTAFTSVPEETAAAAGPVTVRQNNYYKKLYRTTIGMRTQEREMLFINSRIIKELIDVLKRYKSQEELYSANRNKALRGTLNTIFAGVSELSVLTGVFLMMLIITLLYNTWRIFRHEKKLVAYSEDAIRFAEEKSAFLANMSHEIRTPLNSIAGFSEQLEQSSLNTVQSGQIKAVRNSAAMLLNVVNQVLDYSKYETGKMIFEDTSFLLDKVLTEVAVSMGILAEQKGLYLRTELKYDKKLFLSGDAFRLRQVIMNLVSNAIKFTKTGEVALHAWTEAAPGGLYTLNVAVNDTGIGISQADLPFIFKEFTQAGSSRKQNRSGTGLGLAISKSIVELQGGKIFVESEPGRGSVFSFNIPFKSGQIIAGENNAAFNEQEVRVFLKNKRVLLAEDNRLNVLLAKTILHKWHMTCEVAYNGKEALNLFENNDYDLILTDIQMPEMGGVELASLVRRASDLNKAKIPILALTANVLSEDHEHYLGAGINAIALKPFLEKDLIHKIQILLSNFSHLTV